MANNGKPRQPTRKTEPDDEITTVKVYRSEAKALAIIAEAHEMSQPEAARRVLGGAFNRGAQAAIEMMQESIAPKRA